MPRPLRTTKLLALAVLAATLSFARTPRADVPPDAAAVAEAHRAAIVAHVGPRAIATGDLEARLARVPRYQLRDFGRTSPEIARAFFEKVLLRDVLLSLGAEDKRLDHEVSVEQGLDRVLSGATLREIIAEVGGAGGVTTDEVQRYYDANVTRFASKDRINVWRILCSTRDEAQTVLTEAKKDGSVVTFTRLAREHSIDKATSMRAGNLGFVSEGGASNEPGVLVASAVVAAAAGVKDGELVPAPVQEGTSFAVVWRRGTQPGIHRSMQEARAQIEDAILRQKREAAEKALLDRLHKEKVSQVDESLLGTFDVSIDDGTIGPRRASRGATP